MKFKAAVRKKLNVLSQYDLFQKINNICVAGNDAENIESLLSVSLKKTLNLFHAKRGSIFLLHDNGKKLNLQTSQGMKIKEENLIVKRMGHGIVGRVAQLKKPLLVKNISKDKRFKNYKSRRSYRTPSFICAPLMIKDKLIGVINISDKKSEIIFTDEELQLLDFLSNQIAINHQRTILNQKLKSIIKESQQLKNQLGKHNEEAHYLKKQIIIHEKLASLGKLAGGIAHEFNNPLDGVIRYTNLCLEHIKDDDVVRGYLFEIKQGLKRMTNIVKSLLACARNSQPAIQKIDVNQSIDQTLNELQTYIVQKNITIKKDLAKSIPPIIDFGVDRILINLLRNAIDAIDKDGLIKIKTVLEAENLCIKIYDSGQGIPQEHLEKIFEPFFTTKKIEQGCGLGLTIVSEIVKHYNGKIEVKSSFRQGTTFTILLPMNES